MSNTKFFNDAVAEAKEIRETALANAKLALEEAFTPKIQSMLEKKLQEEEDDLDEEKAKDDMDEAKAKDMDEAKDTTDESVTILCFFHLNNLLLPHQYEHPRS